MVMGPMWACEADLNYLFAFSIPTLTFLFLLGIDFAVGYYQRNLDQENRIQIGGSLLITLCMAGFGFLMLTGDPDKMTDLEREIDGIYQISIMFPGVLMFFGFAAIEGFKESKAGQKAVQSAK